MSFWLGVVAFGVGLTVSIVLHEAGHFVFARRFGMKATQFFVGFGPTIWSRRQGETEYGVKWILLGGYVKIAGMTPLEQLPPADRPRAFFRRKGWHRAIVLASGSLINVVLAFVFFVILALTLGVRAEPVGTNVVRTVSACVHTASNAACRPDDPQAPAKLAGLRPGDKIVSIGDRPVSDWQQLTGILHTRGPGPAVVVVERDGARLGLTVNLVPAQRRPGAFLGVGVRFIPGAVERKTPLEASGYALGEIGRMFVGVKDVLIDLPSALPYLFSPNRADTPGGQVSSVYGAAELTGQIFAANEPWHDTARTYLALLAALNVFVGVFNLLPLLPLDGGHLAVLAYERGRALVARRQGRPDPGPVDYAKLTPVTVVGFFLLLGLGLLLIAADITNPLKVLQ